MKPDANFWDTAVSFFCSRKVRSGFYFDEQCEDTRVFMIWIQNMIEKNTQINYQAYF